MGSGNRPVNDAELKVRIPDTLKSLLEALAVGQCVPLSHIVRSLLETHPTVVWAAERLYNGGMETSQEGSAP